MLQCNHEHCFTIGVGDFKPSPPIARRLQVYKLEYDDRFSTTNVADPWVFDLVPIGIIILQQGLTILRTESFGLYANCRKIGRNS